MERDRIEDEGIKEIFSSYDPELSSSMAFMERLERNLDAVELIHQENAAVLKRNRIAVAIASAAGFAAGVIFTLLLPYIYGIVRSIIDSFPAISNLDPTGSYSLAAAYIVIGAVSVFVAVNTYSLSLSLRPSLDGRRED